MLALDVLGSCCESERLINLFGGKDAGAERGLIKGVADPLEYVTDLERGCSLETEPESCENIVLESRLGPGRVGVEDSLWEGLS